MSINFEHNREYGDEGPIISILPEWRDYRVLLYMVSISHFHWRRFHWWHFRSLHRNYCERHRYSFTFILFYFISFFISFYFVFQRALIFISLFSFRYFLWYVVLFLYFSERRRTNTLYELGQKSVASTVMDVTFNFMKELANHPRDVPFSLIYLKGSQNVFHLKYVF